MNPIDSLNLKLLMKIWIKLLLIYGHKIKHNVKVIFGIFLIQKKKLQNEKIQIVYKIFLNLQKPDKCYASGLDRNCASRQFHKSYFLLENLDKDTEINANAKLGTYCFTRQNDYFSFLFKDFRCRFNMTVREL